MYVENKNVTCGRKIWLPFHQSIAHTLFFLRFFITSNGPHVIKRTLTLELILPPTIRETGVMMLGAIWHEFVKKKYVCAVIGRYG
jgi:hypothetical protein